MDFPPHHRLHAGFKQGLLLVVDFGSGKSYLTFALYHLLANIRQYDVTLVGVDRNPEVIADCAMKIKP